MYILLIWENAPPHHPKRVLQEALARGIEIGFLPFRSPDLKPCEDLWRGLNSDVAAIAPLALWKSWAGGHWPG